jgi:hypothetical protein
MTLVEFIAPLKKSTHGNRILATLYFMHRYEKQNALTTDQIKQALKKARAPRWTKVNIADVIAKSGHYVDSPGVDGNKRLWSLTPSGIGYIQDLLGLPSAEPEIEHDIGTLSSTTKKIKDSQIKDYVNEALKCLQINALRASVVFLWTGAIRTIQSQIMKFGLVDINNAIQKHDPKARQVKSLDSFAYIKDKVSLLAAQELGILDKNQKDTLEEALNLRNRCGHPSKYAPGVKKVSSYIEDVVSIVFL